MCQCSEILHRSCGGFFELRLWVDLFAWRLAGMDAGGDWTWWCRGTFFAIRSLQLMFYCLRALVQVTDFSFEYYKKKKSPAKVKCLHVLTHQLSHLCWVNCDAPRMEGAERRSLFSSMLCFTCNRNLSRWNQVFLFLVTYASTLPAVWIRCSHRSDSGHYWTWHTNVVYQRVCHQ